MTKEENLSKIDLLKNFCEQNGISEDDVSAFLQQSKKDVELAPFEIYYEDGEISCRIDLKKKPLAFKVLIFGIKYVWFAVSILKNADFYEAEEYMKGLAPISKKPWRILNEFELNSFFRAKDRKTLSDFQILRKVFGLSDLTEKYHDILIGCIAQTDEVYTLFLTDESKFFVAKKTDKINWWPMCDAD